MRRIEQQTGWGLGSYVTFIVVALCVLFLPLVIGPGSLPPPPPYLLLTIPVVLVFICLYLSYATNH
ncbi:uncharacterized protein LOC113750310 [Coffea eugenioides]|uniref:uncharacterized protein LOC113750310 n=1 Tax=Coffea eugenioides TaxID=49369 RepID=UPI000F606932|nr:uncharacterized protein LOC113750310 [Coffea eugenioides]